LDALLADALMKVLPEGLLTRVQQKELAALKSNDCITGRQVPHMVYDWLRADEHMSVMCGHADLLEIYRRFAHDANIRLAVGVNERVTTAIKSAAEQAGFGNARFVRALWEESYANMAVRAASDGETTSSELEEILPVDVPEGVGSPLGLKRKIGF
jgi:hypothetical protein